MARPREFDIEKACEDAMNIFWDGGYKGTSLPDLLDGLGLSRGSLYKAFGNKKNLFLKSLELYDSSVLQPGIRLLEDDAIPSGAERIEKFFSFAIAHVEAGDRRGCLLCNAAVGAAHHDKDVGSVVHRMLADMTKGFQAALKASVTYSGSSADAIAAKANSITMSYVGLRVLARSGEEIEQLRSAVKSALEGV